VIETGGLKLYPRLEANETELVDHGGTAESGSDQLDSLLGGGLDRGASTLLLGPAGCGKTTLCSHYLYSALKRGEHVACYLFEESRETFLRRSGGFGMSFEPYLASGKLELVQINIGKLSPGEFSARVRRAVEDDGTKFIVIDSLNGYLNGMPSEKHLLIHLHELLAYLGQKGVVTLMTIAQHGMMGTSMHSPIDASFLADSVILMRFFEAGGVVRQAISVVKKRRGAHERTLREVKIGPRGMQVGEVLEEFEGVLTGVPKYVGKSTQLLGTPESH
jgi:circadian clock protein KaiC